MPICNYCCEDKDLMKAHIVPKSFYNKEQLENTVLVTSEENAPLVRTPIGVFDRSILCSICDGKLGLIEQHATLHLLRGEFRGVGYNQGREYFNADAELIRRFAIAVVWKISISHLGFNDPINCGPYQDKMLEILNETNDYREIDVAISEFNVEDPIMLNPCHNRFDGVNFVMFYAGRFIFYVKIDKRKMPEFLMPASLLNQKVVRTIIRSWQNSKERDVISNMSFRSKALTKQVSYWKRKGLYPTSS